MTYDPTDPDHMSADDRRAEVAAILAAGVLRLRRRSFVDHPAVPKSPPDSTPNRLDVSAQSRPHATPWLKAQREGVTR